MKILVTGGAGFIGSHVVDAFVKDGHEVAVIDNLSTGVRENLNSRTVFYQGDITNAKFVQKTLQGFRPDVIDHHAAHIHVGKSVKDPLFDAQINILGTINLLQESMRAGCVKKFIFASTGGAMYGNKKTPFTEDMMPAPLSPYGVSKGAAELYLGFYREQYGLSYVVLRYANVYGPRQNPHGEAGVISIFSKNILEKKQPVINGDGKQTRDYVYVDDVARANTSALLNDDDGIFNIGTGIETDVNAIFEMVNKEFKSDWKMIHGPPRNGEQKTSSLLCKRAQDILGWKPKVKLEDGIKMTVEWFKKYPERA